MKTYNEYLPFGLIIGSGLLVWWADKQGSASHNDDHEGAEIFNFAQQMEKRGLSPKSLTWQEAQAYLRKNSDPLSLVADTFNRNRKIDIGGDEVTVEQLLNLMQNSVRVKRHVVKNFGKVFVRGLNEFARENK